MATGATLRVFPSAVWAWLLLLACQAPLPVAERASAPSPRAKTAERLRQLRVIEAAFRERFDARTAPPWIDVSGADPYRLLPNDGGYVGILRGAKALVTLDGALTEQRRLALSEAPTALALVGRRAWVASRWSRSLSFFDLDGGERGSRTLPVASVDDIAGDASALHVLARTDRGAVLLTLDPHGNVLDERSALPGGLRLVRRGRFLLELSLFEHTLRVLELGPQGRPLREVSRIRHDGPIWAADARDEGGSLLVAVSGAEDKPLVRAHGEFENIDSFLWLYRIDEHGTQQLLALNVSDYGLILPKAVALTPHGNGFRLRALAAGSGRLLSATWSASAAPTVVVDSAMPGASDAIFSDDRVSYASPLLDAWVTQAPSGLQVIEVDPETRPSLELRLGEALLTTELMAPSNTSEGPHSRFTCETCHFEGGVDGRTHFTGRGNVSVVTKPLFGLANNRPHFSRAKDPDLSAVTHNEFRVAGAGSGDDPWFCLETARFPWLFELGIERAQLSPLELRSALLAFLYAFSHAPNARSGQRATFSPLEAQGAQIFRDRCVSCHAPRTVSDDPRSEVPFEAWEPLVLSRNGPIVWARGDYARTGVEPYVDAQGTRITSLRRLALKPRYFTSGAAPSLAAVLERFRDTSAGGSHIAPPNAAGALGLDDQRALLSFLELL